MEVGEGLGFKYEVPVYVFITIKIKERNSYSGFILKYDVLTHVSKIKIKKVHTYHGTKYLAI